MLYLGVNEVHCGRAEELLLRVEPYSIQCSVWSPPYHVGKEYEKGMTFEGWQTLLRSVIAAHQWVLAPGGFLAINIADILCFKDPEMPRLMAENVTRRKRGDITREQVLGAWQEHPDWNRKQIAAHLGCSEQTVDRRMKGNNIRGGKYQAQTRVKLVGGLLEEMALEAGLYLYDRRVWVKDAAWENSRWHTMSYRAVDEFEYVYIFWKPGITRVDKERLTPDEWKAWGARAVWPIPSVRANDDHEAKFPLELPRRVIRLLSDAGDTILDCFLGSGTSAVAAILERRNFVGIEMLAPYVELANRACDLARQEVAARVLPLEAEPVEQYLPAHGYAHQGRLLLEGALTHTPTTDE